MLPPAPACGESARFAPGVTANQGSALGELRPGLQPQLGHQHVPGSEVLPCPSLGQPLQAGWEAQGSRGLVSSSQHWLWLQGAGVAVPLGGTSALPPRRPWAAARGTTLTTHQRPRCVPLAGQWWAGSALGACAAFGTLLCKARQDGQWWLSRIRGCEHPGCNQHPRPRAPGAVGGEQTLLSAHSVYSPSHWALVVIFAEYISTHELKSMIKLQVHKQGRSLPVEAE